MVLAAVGLLRQRFWVGLLQQWGSTPALLGGDPVEEGFGVGAEGWGLALALLGKAPMAVGLDAGVEG
jgi:hypothetical protein